jgi:hypothetical protein
MKDARRDRRAYRNKVVKERRRAELHGATCCFCAQSIDMALHPSDRWAFTLHHIQPLATGGHILGPTLPAHRSCNSKYGDGTRTDPLAGASRDW